jgi:hypothetical protein
VDKISNYKINGYSMSRERADLDSHMPSWDTEQQGWGTQDDC